MPASTPTPAYRDSRRWLCRSHPDFHMPAEVEIGARCDGDALSRRLREAGADTFAVFAKCHYGHAYYPTRVGTPHPRLRKDLLAEVVRGCHAHGIAVTAYYSVFYDGAAISRHPEWAMVRDNGRTASSQECSHFHSVCVNSRYLEEMLIPQCLEVMREYAVDELLFDPMTWFRPCYCPTCRAGFGGDIPCDDQDPRWLDYVAWYKGCFERFYARMAQALHRERPDVGLVFNWCWGVRQPQPPLPQIQRLCADWSPSVTSASRHARQFAGAGLPFDFMCGRFLHGLGDWDDTTPDSLRGAAAATAANGGGFYIIDRMLPDGTLEERAFAAMRSAFGLVQERRACLEGATPVPEVAVLSAAPHIDGPDLRFFPDPNMRDERQLPVDGIARLAAECAVPYHALGEERLRATINDYRAVIVPEQDLLALETIAALEAFARTGGSVLIIQSGTAANAEQCALAGVAHLGFSELGYGYIGTRQPFHVRGRFSTVQALDAEILHPSLAPLTTVGRFGHGLAPATTTVVGPAVTRRRLGAGQVLYIAVPIASSYARWTHPASERLLLELIALARPEPIAHLDTAARVELSLMRQGDDLVLHLVNHSGHERPCPPYYTVTDYMPELRDLPLSLRVGKARPEIHRAPGGAALPYTVADGRAQIRVPSLTHLESLVVTGYFRNAP